MQGAGDLAGLVGFERGFLDACTVKAIKGDRQRAAIEDPYWSTLRELTFDGDFWRGELDELTLLLRASLPALKGKYDMVNIKLDKTGGLTEALALRAEAQAQGVERDLGLDSAACSASS